MATKDLTLRAGLWRGVKTTYEPFDDDASEYLQSATNCYVADPKTRSGCYSRPGWLRPQSVSSANDGQGVYAHVALDGTAYNFVFVGGKVYRWPTDLTSAAVDVTPLNVVISTTATRIYVTSLNGEIIVNDGVNKMWRGSSLGATPIVATIIEQQTPATILSIGSNDVRLANTAFTGTWSGTQATFAANAVGTAVGALGQIAADTWGIILVEASNSTTLVFTAAFNAGAGYATEALAIAALPARTVGRKYVGYVTVRADAGAVWIAGTDAFATGSTGNQAQTTNYYAGEGPAYSVFGQPVIYYGAVFVIYQQVEAVYARTTIGWSEPNEPAVGYQQTDYDNQWTLTQTSSDALYALAATNDALYYSRQWSWGAVMGAPGVNFQGTATHDVVSGNVGCTAPATVRVFRDTVFFADALGRPYRFTVGGTPEALWTQARGQFEYPLTTSDPTAVVATLAFGMLEPNLNIYLTSWLAGSSEVATRWFLAFDVRTGSYLGLWDAGSLTMRAGGQVRDANGGTALLMLQRTSGGAVWFWRLTRQYENSWNDNGSTPSLSVQTPWLFYDGALTVRCTQVRLLQISAGGVPTVQVGLSSVGQGIENLSRAPTAIVAGGLNAYSARIIYSGVNTAVGRGLAISATPTDATLTAQWRLWRIEADVTPDGIANIEDR